MPRRDVTRSSSSYFYKYRSSADVSRLESILLRNEIYFAAPAQLDDDLEARPRLTAKSTQALAGMLFNVWMKNHPGRSPQELDYEYCKILFGMYEIAPTEVLRMLSDGLHLEFAEHRILSLSTRYDIEDCWQRYGDGHRGCCFEFANAGPLFGLAMSVVYGDEFSIDVTDRDQITVDFLFHKTWKWREQVEARVIGVRGGPKLNHFDPSLLRRVILGKDISAQARAAILDVVARRPKPVPVVVAQLNERQRLVLSPLAAT